MIVRMLSARLMIGLAGTLFLCVSPSPVSVAPLCACSPVPDWVGTIQEDDVKTDSTNPLERRGEIQNVGEAIKQLFALKWKGKQLELRFPTDPQLANTQFDRIRQLSGFGGGGSSWGGDGFEFNSNSPKLQTRMIRRKLDASSYQTGLSMQEKSPFNRSLEIMARDDGYFQIRINDHDAGYLLRIRQLSDGHFSVQELDGVNVFASSGQTFESICRKEREFVESRLTPALSHFGLGTLVTPYCEAVQKTVVSIVGPWTETERQIVESLIAGLDSDSFEVRQEASSRLEDATEDERQLLSRVINDSRFSPEVRTRLRSLVREKASDEELAQMEFIDELLRRLDFEYLDELVELQNDQVSRDILIAYRDSIGDGTVIGESQIGTGDSIDESLPTRTTAVEAELLSEQGVLQQVSVETAALVHLIWNGDQLSVDRKHWAEPFGGKSIKELADEVQSAIQEAHLPKNWFHAGGTFDIESVYHPQVLFERLEVKATGNSDELNPFGHAYYHGRQNGSLNREFRTSLLTGRLQFEDNDNRPANRGHGGNANAASIEKNPFLLTLAETTNPGRVITIQESAEGELHVLMTGEASDYVVQMTIDGNRALVQDIRGDLAQAYVARDFRQLLNENRKYFEGSFFPLLRHLGISVDPAIVPLSNSPSVETDPDD